MGKTILVLINGHAGVGKDTFVDFCREYAEETHPCRVYNIHRSDAPKIALHSLGWKGEKNESARSLLKHMVDFMEENGILNDYLDEQIRAAVKVNSKDIIIFYHVRDPKVMYELMDRYIEEENIFPISLLVKRDLKEQKEPDEWWGDLETAEYQMTLQLKNGLDSSKMAAQGFIDFLLDEEWEIVKNEGSEENE